MKQDLIEKTVCYSVDNYCGKTGRLKFRASKYLTILVRKNDGYHIYSEPGSAKNSVVEGSEIVITETGVNLRIKISEEELRTFQKGGVIVKQFTSKKGNPIKTKYLANNTEALQKEFSEVSRLKKVKMYNHV